MVRIKAFFLSVFLAFCGNVLAEQPLDEFSELVAQACQEIEEDRTRCDKSYLNNGLKKINLKSLDSSDLEFLYSELGGDGYGLILTESYLRDGYYCKARDVLLNLDDSNIKVMHTLGIFSYRGFCRNTSYKEAYSFFHKASARGNLDSYYYKGLMLYAGRGVEQNLIEAGRVFLWLAAFDHDKTVGLIEMLSNNGYLDSEEFDRLLKERIKLVEIFNKESEVRFLDEKYFKEFLSNYEGRVLEDLESLKPPEK